MAKIDDIRCFAENIAQWRVDGLTWAQIATKLGEEGIRVGTDEIRSYWPRLSDGRSPAEHLLYWQGSQRNAELRESKRRAEAAEAETAALRRQVQQWELQMRSLLLQDQQNETLRAEWDKLREEARQRKSALVEEIELLRHQIGELTERAAAWQREAVEANGRTQVASADVHQLRQQVSNLEHKLAEAEACTAKAVAENEVYGNIRYYMGKGEGQTQLDEMNKILSGWVRFGEALCQAHHAGNKTEIAHLLDRVVAWAASRGKA